MKVSEEDINELNDQELSDVFGKPPLVKEPSMREENLRAFFPYMDKTLRKKGFTREKLWKEICRKTSRWIPLRTVLCLLSQMAKESKPCNAHGS